MTNIRVELPIDRPAAAVWPLLADFGAIDVFNPHVADSRIINGTAATGIGSERQCDLSDGKNWIRERVVDWREGHSYTVDIYEGTMPIERIVTHLGVEPDAQRSRGFMDMTYVPKYGPLGRVLDALMLRATLRKTMTGVLRGLREKAEAKDTPVAPALPRAA